MLGNEKQERHSPMRDPLLPVLREKVNRFKALVIGGGGLFVAKHAPLYVDSFAEGLTLPIVVLGVGANRWVAATWRRAFTGHFFLTTHVVCLCHGNSPIVRRVVSIIRNKYSLRNAATHAFCIIS